MSAAFMVGWSCFFFNATATAEIYTLSLHDALPIWIVNVWETRQQGRAYHDDHVLPAVREQHVVVVVRSEEHTSELQSQFHLVCRLLLEKKNLVADDAHVAGLSQAPDRKQSRIRAQR